MRLGLDCLLIKVTTSFFGSTLPSTICTAFWNCYYCIILCRNLSDVLWEAIRHGQVLSLYQGLGTKNLQSVIQQFVYFYGYSFLKRLYLKKSNFKSMGTKANLIVAAAAGACTVLITQVGWSIIYHCLVYLNVKPSWIYSVMCHILLHPWVSSILTEALQFFFSVKFIFIEVGVSAEFSCAREAYA